MIGLAVSVAMTVCAADQPSGRPPLIERGSKATTYYYLSPDPKLAVELLDDVLKKENLEHPWFRNRSDVLRIIAAQIGLIARGHPELVRQCEARFDGATPAGRRLILRSLRVCGDEPTLGQIDKWLAREEDAAVRKDLQETRDHIADPRRKRFREKAPTSPHEMDLLWADFFITGEYEPVSRILDVLDIPSEKSNPILRGVAGWSLRANMRQHPKLVELLRKHTDQRAEPSRKVVNEYLQAFPSGPVKPAVTSGEPVVP
jgi:hypothetical protein